MSQQIFRTATIVVAALVLSACASSFKSNVTSFHSETPPAGARIALTPLDEKRSDSLAFKQYANDIVRAAQRSGFVGANGGEADYIVSFDVAVNDGREKIRSNFAGGGFGGFGGGFGGPFWHPGFGWGGYGGFGGFGGGNVSSRTIYRAELHIEIRKQDGTMVFESTAETDTRKRSLPELVPLLAAAIFEEFPGEHGRTRRIKLDLSAQ
ncbi:DUF4136 domain-containing protein [Kordiimonas aquimaris]|uniref:DUF4136 domain-containing protein n=1 Tax=Kordiimonas aquimaris TaxID=707591 RepID=UPI0021D384BC|nr:DUF4136 domain-containing protein [Kordiimonas aquimaris]